MIGLVVSTCIVFVIVMVYYLMIFKYNKKYKKTPKKDRGTQSYSSPQVEEERIQAAPDSIKDTILAILKSLNCAYEIEHDGTVVFEYQAAKFRIIYYEERAMADLYYLYFYTGQYENINALRYLCNDQNTQSKTTKFFYSLDEKSNEVDIHCSTHILFTRTTIYIRNIFIHALNELFLGQRNFVNAVEEVIERSAKTFAIDDDEIENFKQRRELFMLREQEMLLYPETKKIRSNENDFLTLQQMLQKTMDLIDASFISLTQMGSDTKEWMNAEEIESFNLLDALIDTTNPREAYFKEKNMMFLLIYRNAKLKHIRQRQQMMINLKAEGESDESLYVRITCCIIPNNVSKSIVFNSKANEAVSCSFLTAFDKLTTSNKAAKLKYMLEDAIEKVGKDQYSELTEEQKMIFDCSNESIAYDLYYGRFCFLNKRYYEALFYLENAFAILNESFHSLNSMGRNKFFHICYYIGFCYCELGLYKQAYFYLNITIDEENYLFLQEYVNCVTNMNDFRAIYSIRNLIERINQQLEESEGNVSEDFVFFINFIKRRHAYVLINIKHYDEAELLLREMLEDPANKDFAINELAYLQRIRE